MVKKILFGSIFFIAAVALFWEINRVLVYDKNNKRIMMADEKVIEKLKKIRLAQKCYYDMKGTYADSWIKLADFIANESIPVIQKKEVVKTVNGVDEVTVYTDTLGVVPVYDSLKRQLGMTKSELKNIGQVPLNERKEFILEVKVTNGISFIQVTDPEPLSPFRDPKKKDQPALKFGALYGRVATTKGNWE